MARKHAIICQYKSLWEIVFLVLWQAVSVSSTMKYARTNASGMRCQRMLAVGDMCIMERNGSPCDYAQLPISGQERSQAILPVRCR